MRVWALWHGGSSYSAPTMADLEEFSSISAAREAFTHRFNGGRWASEFRYVNREWEGAATPGVGEDSTMTLWLYDPTNVEDPYPWRIIQHGARGGVRVDYA